MDSVKLPRCLFGIALCISIILIIILTILLVIELSNNNLDASNSSALNSSVPNSSVPNSSVLNITSPYDISTTPNPLTTVAENLKDLIMDDSDNKILKSNYYFCKSIEGIKLGHLKQLFQGKIDILPVKSEEKNMFNIIKNNGKKYSVLTNNRSVILSCIPSNFLND
ncbi:hypothetical protein DMUE_4122 [Dictyocoela muelleri]|nr:hypothetical protein DMUE_4122 [Dictyocoela muelleri]